MPERRRAWCSVRAFIHQAIGPQTRGFGRAHSAAVGAVFSQFHLV
jgi:hypothetical protein